MSDSPTLSELAAAREVTLVGSAGALVTLFASSTTSAPELDISLTRYIADIQNGVHAESIEAIRSAASRGDRERVAWLKRRLPAVTLSCTMQSRAKDALVRARAIIDWELKGQSIFERTRPLSPKTLARIEAGLKKFGLAPFIAAWDHQSGTGIWGQEVPLSTVTSKARHGVVEPFLVKMRGTSVEQIAKHSAMSLDDPTPTITAGGGHLGLVEPFIVPNFGERSGQSPRVHSVNQPLPAVTSHGAGALVQPYLLPQQSGGAPRPVSEPVPTVATDGAIGLVQPFLVKYYGTGRAQSTAEPLDTVTTKDRHALVRPEVTIDGERYRLDIRFRMLQPHELAAAQGFKAGYRFAGNKTEQVKQIGNAVPRRLARALVTAALSQDANVSWLSAREKEVA